MTRTVPFAAMTRLTAVAVAVVLAGCTPTQAARVNHLLGRPQTSLGADAAVYQRIACDDPAAAVTALGDELDHVVGDEGAPSCHPPGWVDLGHGVYGPAVLLRVRWCESRDDYQAENPRSSSSGGWQFISRTWRYVTGTPPPASSYPASVQDDAAVRLLTMPGGGLGHWAPSRHCWEA